MQIILVKKDTHREDFKEIMNLIKEVTLEVLNLIVLIDIKKDNLSLLLNNLIVELYKSAKLKKRTSI